MLNLTRPSKDWVNYARMSRNSVLINQAQEDFTTAVSTLNQLEEKLKEAKLDAVELNRYDPGIRLILSG